MSNLLEVVSLTKLYKVSRGFLKKSYVRAVKEVSFSIKEREVFSLVGESGSGKTTIGKVILRLEKPTEGSIKLRGKDIQSMGREYSKKVSAVFQDPSSSLNPYMKVREVIEEPMVIHKVERRREKLEEVLEMAKLPKEVLDKKPLELSGGQRQRVAIARAITLSPELLVADEPTSSLDASVRKEILDLFVSLKDKGISTLLITHDIRAVERIGDMVGVIYRGVLVELGKKEEVLKEPLHPYTKYLLSSLPVRHPRERKEDYDYRELSKEREDFPCPFYALCPYKMDICKEGLKEVYMDGRLVKCHLY